jgi:hypothetical protein
MQRMLFAIDGRDSVGNLLSIQKISILLENPTLIARSDEDKKWSLRRWPYPEYN